MTFYGRDPEPKPTPGLNKYVYSLGPADAPDDHWIEAEHVFFYESGHVGFWNDKPDGTRKLVLAVKAERVWEE